MREMKIRHLLLLYANLLSILFEDSANFYRHALRLETVIHCISYREFSGFVPMLKTVNLLLCIVSLCINTTCEMSFLRYITIARIFLYWPLNVLWYFDFLSFDLSPCDSFEAYISTSYNLKTKLRFLSSF